MTKGLNENEWTAIKAVVISLILEGGIAFVILAVIFKLIDAESARYLLSAIVQSLAALLAIIFAGVAILWGQEGGYVNSLRETRERMSRILFSKEEGKTNRLKKLAKDLIGNIKKIPRPEQAKTKAKLFSVMELLAMDLSIDFREDAQNSHGVLEELRKMSKGFIHLESASENPKHAFEGFIARSDLISNPVESKEFFSKIQEVTSLLSVCKTVFKATDKEERDVTFLNEHIVFLEALKIELNNAKRILSRICKAKDARGPRFQFLISWYSITIAGGMVLLSLLKAGICESQATWIAAFPLGFGIGAVALTFVYLARIVSGEKE